MSTQSISSKESVAVIGMACTYPQAPNLKAFWRNILEAVYAITDPDESWEADRYLSPGRISTAKGGYLKDLYHFNPGEFGVMPNSVDGGEPDQYLALRIARDALQDAGYLGNEYDHTDTGVVLGHSTYLHRGQASLIQNHIVLDQTIELLRAIFPTLDNLQMSEVRDLLEQKLPPSNADNAPGLVPNVMTGRIANRLNLKGPNYIVDAACSSSLLAVNAAVDELLAGRSRIMLAGGVNGSLPAEASVIFTQLGALSKSGRIKPFDKECDGTLLGEGIGIVVLKRLSDSIEDGDRIYAVIKGTGIASDGKALGLLAPNSDGEMLAIRRAYATSGIDPGTVELIEAHGSGIPLGDQTEITALRNVFGSREGLQGNIGIGTVKSLIGHCIPAAGMAGFIKTALALHHKILPPTRCQNINPELNIETTPFYINIAPRPWISSPGIPRRAGVNAFGFGGINTHAILEEAPAISSRPHVLSAWPYEICVFSGPDVENLAVKLKKIHALLEENEDFGLSEISAMLIAQDENDPHRLSIVAKDVQDLSKKITAALKRLEKSDDRWTTRTNIFYSSRPVEGKMAVMFPGEGSQYLNMLEDLANYFDEVRHWFDFWRGLYNDPPGETRTDIIFPPKSELTEERQMVLEKRLHDMDVGSESVFIGSLGMYALLKSMGIKPDVMVGHSTGESTALAASGAIPYEDSTRLSEYIRKLNAVYQRVLEKGEIPRGALLSVGALPQSTIEEHISATNNDIVVAMDNCANQLVLFGDTESIKKIQTSLSAAGGICFPLPFDRGYHTPRFSAMSEAFLAYYKDIGLKAPGIKMYSCASADLFPEDEEGVLQLAADQWSKKVRFREAIIRMYEDGVRYFVEVGPSGNLCTFVNDTLSGKEHVTVPMNLRRKNDVEQFLVMLSHLYVNGRELTLGKLHKYHLTESPVSAKKLRKQRKAFHLESAMPVLHLGDAESSALKKILLPASDMARESHQMQEKTPAGPPFQDIDNPDKSNHDRHLASEYFDLMRSFLEQQRKVLERFEMPSENQEEVLPEDRVAPFLSEVTALDDRHIEGTCRLCVHSDKFLQHHILSGPVSDNSQGLHGLSCVPLMVSIEIMAEACAVLAGNSAVTIIENIRALQWIALDEDELMLNVRAEFMDNGNRKIRAQLINDGNIAVSADFSFKEDWCLAGIPALSEKRKFRWEGNELYQIGMFHGPIFQSIRRVEGWNDQGIDAILSEVSLEGFFEESQTPELVLNPVLMDAIGQLTAYWIAQQVGTDFNCFPSTIDRIEFFEQCPQNLANLTLRARQQPLKSGSTSMDEPRKWQFECLDNAGKPLFRASNLVNIFFHVPNRFYRVRLDPLNSWIGGPVRGSGNTDVALWQLPYFSEQFCTQSGGIFLRILAHIFLSFEERSEWQNITGNNRRRFKWIAGRACIKEAVRHWIFQHTGELLYPTDIIVSNDREGAPYVDGWWNNNLVPAPEVSLSHGSGISMAAVAPPDYPVGVDVEDIGRIKQSDLIEASLAPSERHMLKDIAGQDLAEKVLRVWCAKEAAAKYLGTGLMGRPKEFEVSFLDTDWRTACVTHNQNKVQVALDCDNKTVIALAPANLE